MNDRMIESSDDLMRFSVTSNHIIMAMPLLGYDQWNINTVSHYDTNYLVLSLIRHKTLT